MWVGANSHSPSGSLRHVWGLGGGGLRRGRGGGLLGPARPASTASRRGRQKASLALPSKATTPTPSYASRTSGGSQDAGGELRRSGSRRPRQLWVDFPFEGNRPAPPFRSLPTRPGVQSPSPCRRRTPVQPSRVRSSRRRAAADSPARRAQASSGTTSPALSVLWLTVMCYVLH